MAYLSDKINFYVMSGVRVVVDLESLMTRNVLVQSGNVAGNVVTTISPGKGKRWTLECFRIWCDTDATAANRYTYVYRYGAIGSLCGLALRGLVTVADQVSVNLMTRSNKAWVGDTNSEVFNVNGDSSFEMILEGDEYVTVSVVNGVAGDVYAANFVFREFDI